MESLPAKLQKIGFEESGPIYTAIYDILILLEYSNLSEVEIRTILEILSENGLNDISLVADVSEWAEFDYGNAKVGSLVRVKDSAYSSETGKRHNGRVGFILSISGRKCRVRYAGTRGSSDLAHPIDNLQSPRYGVK